MFKFSFANSCLAISFYYYSNFVYINWYLIHLIIYRFNYLVNNINKSSSTASKLSIEKLCILRIILHIKLFKFRYFHTHYFCFTMYRSIVFNLLRSTFLASDKYISLCVSPIFSKLFSFINSIIFSKLFGSSS